MFPEKHVIYRYKYLPYSEGALKILSDGTIKYASPLEFNDPFDCLPHYDAASIEKYPQTRPELFKAAAKLRGLSPAGRIQHKQQMIAELRNRIDDGTFVRDLLKDVGVVSLSKNPLNILMWSHYADFHRGFVLEFRIPIMGTMDSQKYSEERLLPLPVTYSVERPHIDLGTELPNQLVKKLLFTKSVDWAYEEEERAIDRNRGPGIHRYRRDEILSSISAGMRMPIEYYQHLVALVSDLSKQSQLDLALFKAQAAVGEYKLHVPGHPRIS